MPWRRMRKNILHFRGSKREVWWNWSWGLRQNLLPSPQLIAKWALMKSRCWAFLHSLLISAIYINKIASRVACCLAKLRWTSVLNAYEQAWSLTLCHYGLALHKPGLTGLKSQTVPTVTCSLCFGVVSVRMVIASSLKGFLNRRKKGFRIQGREIIDFI